MKERVIKATRGFFGEFKSFAIKGNAFELAIAFVIGGAFSAIVTSLVSDIITPLIGFLSGSVDLKTRTLVVRPDLIIKYGAFLQAIINFLIISLSIFGVFKSLTSARKRLFKAGEKATPAYETPPQERLLREIRDLLKKEKHGSLE